MQSISEESGVSQISHDEKDDQYFCIEQKHNLVIIDKINVEVGAVGQIYQGHWAAIVQTEKQG